MGSSGAARKPEQHSSHTVSCCGRSVVNRLHPSEVDENRSTMKHASGRVAMHQNGHMVPMNVEVLEPSRGHGLDGFTGNCLRICISRLKHRLELVCSDISKVGHRLIRVVMVWLEEAYAAIRLLVCMECERQQHGRTTRQLDDSCTRVRDLPHVLPYTHFGFQTGRNVDRIAPGKLDDSERAGGCSSHQPHAAIRTAAIILQKVKARGAAVNGHEEFELKAGLQTRPTIRRLFPSSVVGPSCLDESSRRVMRTASHFVQHAHQLRNQQRLVA